MAQQDKNPTVSVRMQIPSLASLSGLEFQCGHKMWRRSQTLHGSCIAVAVM